MNSFRTSAFIVSAFFTSLLVSAQPALTIVQPAQPDVSMISAPAALADAPETSSPERWPAAEAGPSISGSWSLSDGPLTVEVLDGMSRPMVRLTAPATDADLLRLPTLPMPAGTYTVRVRDARGAELHQQRIAYRP